MTSYLIDARVVQGFSLDHDSLARAAARSDFFWLDLHGPSDEEIARVGEVFAFHPLAIEDAIQFGQRPKLDEYEGHVLLVVFGAAPDEDSLVEVHCFYSERFLVTVRRDPSPAFQELRARHEWWRASFAEPVLVLHRAVDALVDSFFPLLGDFDDFIDAVEEGILEQPGQEQIRRVFLMKRRLVALRRAIAPMRDTMASIASGVARLPLLTPEAERAFRDIYDHLIRLTDTIDSYRDLLTGVTDVYLSTVSNRVGEVTKQLAIIATIFLPLSFVTGFFGQNFGWMVRNVGGLGSFLLLGIGLQLATLAALILFFKRRAWF